MVLGLEFESSKLHCGPHEVRLRAASAMLFSTPSPFSYLSPSLYRHWDHFCLLFREAPQVWAPRVGSMSHPRHRRDAMLRDTASKTVRGVRIAI